MMNDKSIAYGFDILKNISLSEANKYICCLLDEGLVFGLHGNVKHPQPAGVPFSVMAIYIMILLSSYTHILHNNL